MPSQPVTAFAFILFLLMTLFMELDSQAVASDTYIVGGHVSLTDGAGQLTFPKLWPEAPLVFVASSSDGDTVGGRAMVGHSFGQYWAAYVIPPIQGTYPTGAFTTSYIALMPGLYHLPDGRKVEAGFISTTKRVYNPGCQPAGETASWETVSFTHDFAEVPAILTTTQSNWNQNGPWIVVAVQNLTQTGMQLSLDRGGTALDGDFIQPEDIGWLAIEGGSGSGSFIDDDGTSIVYSVTKGTASETAGPVVIGQDLGTNPVVLADLTSRNDPVGGWARLKETETAENRAAGVITLSADSDGVCGSRATQENFNVVAFSAPFTVEMISSTRTTSSSSTSFSSTFSTTTSSSTLSSTTSTTTTTSSTITTTSLTSTSSTSSSSTTTTTSLTSTSSTSSSSTSTSSTTTTTSSSSTSSTSSSSTSTSSTTTATSSSSTSSTSSSSTSTSSITTTTSSSSTSSTSSSSTSTSSITTTTTSSSSTSTSSTTTTSSSSTSSTSSSSTTTWTSSISTSSTSTSTSTSSTSTSSTSTSTSSTSTSSSTASSTTTSSTTVSSTSTSTSSTSTSSTTTSSTSTSSTSMSTSSTSTSSSTYTSSTLTSSSSTSSTVTSPTSTSSTTRSSTAASSTSMSASSVSTSTTSTSPTTTSTGTASSTSAFSTTTSSTASSTRSARHSMDNALMSTTTSATSPTTGTQAFTTSTAFVTTSPTTGTQAFTTSTAFVTASLTTGTQTSTTSTTTAFALSDIGMVMFDLDVAVVNKNDVGTVLEVVKQAMQELQSNAFAGETNLSVTEGNVESKVWIELTEESALNLFEAPNESHVPVYLDSIRAARCGDLGADQCDVQAPNSSTGLKAAYDSRKRRLQGHQLEFVVFVVINAAEDMATLLPLEDPTFITAISDNVASSLPDVTPPSSLAPVLESAQTVMRYEIPEVNREDVPTLQKRLLEGSAIVQVVEAVAATTNISNSSIVLGQPEVNLCAGRTCSGHGQCVQGVCECSSTWTGVNCRIAAFIEVPIATTSTPMLSAKAKASTSPPMLTVLRGEDDKSDWEMAAFVCSIVLGLCCLSPAACFKFKQIRISRSQENSMTETAITEKDQQQPGGEQLADQDAPDSTPAGLDESVAVMWV